MTSRTLPDAVDTRVVFKAYAIVAWVVGFFLFGWPPRMFWVDLVGLPHAKTIPVRIVGAIVMAAGCFAYTLVRVEDRQVRRRALAFFAGGHVIVLAIVIMQLLAVVGDPGVAGRVSIMALLAATVFFWHFWWSAEGLPPMGLPEHRSLLDGSGESSAQRLRSTYEEQIRAAASQEERNRLARDLHDSIKQQIFVIQTAAATAQARFDDDRGGAGAAIEQVRSSAREAMREMEAMLDQLRAAPLENTGLVEALKKQCEALGFRTGADVRFELGTLPPNESLPPGSQQALFRIAQEALANVARHARATHVTVGLDSTDNSVLLRVQDDGAGFETEGATGGMGIGNMQTRAAAHGGTVALQSRSGAGTIVLASLPRLPDERTNSAFYRRRAVLFGAILGTHASRPAGGSCPGGPTRTCWS